MNSLKGRISHLPGGRTRIVTGGTRNTIKLSRPWQTPLASIVRPETCPFCKDQQDEVPLPPEAPSGWRLINNMFTPHQAHRLIIPADCWDAEKTQTWGGAGSIREVLEIASLITEDRPEEMILCSFVGPQAGQNLGHPHWHLFDALVERVLSDGDLLGYANDETVQISEDSEWIVAAGGARAGELLIVPKGRTIFDSATAGSLSRMMSKLIVLCNEKFRSTEGLPPPYGLGIRIGDDRTVRYGNYNPFLYNWGLPESSIAPLEGIPMALAWSHEATAAWLKA